MECTLAALIVGSMWQGAFCVTFVVLLRWKDLLARSLGDISVYDQTAAMDEWCIWALERQSKP